MASTLGADEGGELDHEAGAGVQIVVRKDFVEGEVVEVLDQLGVGDLQGRDVAGEQLVVVLVCGVADRHEVGLSGECAEIRAGRPAPASGVPRVRWS
jgi:hypothetical protein